MSLRLILLLIFLIALFPSYRFDVPVKDILENGHKIIDRLKDLNNPGFNLYAELALMSLRTVNAAKLLNPEILVGVAITSAILQPESEEMKMLKKIDESIIKNFVGLSHKVKYDLIAPGLEILALDYAKTVEVRLSDLHKHLENVLNPISREISSDAIADFQDKCMEAGTSPWDILKLIEAYIECGRTTKESIELDLDIKPALQAMLRATKDRASSRENLIYSDLYGFGQQFRRISSMHNATRIVKRIRQHLKKMKQLSFETLQHAQTYFDELITRHTEPAEAAAMESSGCIIDDFAIANGWRANPVFSLGIEIESHIQLVYILGGFCLGTAYHGKDHFESRKKALIDRYSRLSTMISSRTINLMRATWPLVDEREIKAVVEKMEYKKTSKEEIAANTLLLFERLNSIGVPGYGKQVLMTGLGRRENSFTLKCFPEYCHHYNFSKADDGHPQMSVLVVRTLNSDYYIR
ncbi:hypothetical protein WR25_15621 [Diploscapter pachys]|uniref:Uncharacterized protein n=1 Tax=Diploscapter pachys TaxID=2018661 RepID=A0A2A2M0A5_9BILA|nr:hypothetical protein WR25_15621 [Diploscapter pachys]